MTPSLAQAATSPDPATLEALRRVIAAQIGPRRIGTIYQNTDGAFEVVEEVTDPARASELLRRRCAQWALIVRDVLRPDGEPFAVGSVWTTEDHLIRAANDACVLCGYWRCRCRGSVTTTPTGASVTAVAR